MAKTSPEVDIHAIGAILAELDPSIVVALARLAGRTDRELEVQLCFLRYDVLGVLSAHDLVSNMEIRDADQHGYTLYWVKPGFQTLTRLASLAVARIADRHHEELVAYLREQYPTT